MASAPHHSPGSVGTAMTAAAYGTSRATLWTGVSVLIADAAGHDLVQRVDYRDVRLLPGGAVDAEEAPSRAAAREVLEELGIHLHTGRALAVDWIPAATPGFDPAMNFPGEVIYVFDGGTWDSEQIAAIRLPETEILGIDLVEPAALASLMEPGDARRALSALRAREAAGAVVLENGYPITPSAPPGP